MRDGRAPTVKVSPHPTGGTSALARRAARLRRHPRGRRCRRCAALRRLAARGRRRAHPPGRAGRPRPHARRRRRWPAGAPSTAIPVLEPGRARATRSSWTGCATLAPDCCPVVAYGALIPPAALDIPRHGWVNLHFSLLPAWRGAAPVQHAVMAGDEVTGATTFQLEEGLDTGPVLRRADRADPARRHRRRPARPAGRDRRRAAGGDARRDRGRHAAGPRRSRPTGVSLRAEGHRRRRRVDWARAGARDRPAGPRPARRRPGAWTTFRGERLKLGPVRRARTRADASWRPASWRCARTEVLVGTGDRCRCGSARSSRQGKRAMPAADWARGARPAPGSGSVVSGARPPTTPAGRRSPDRAPAGRTRPRRRGVRRAAGGRRAGRLRQPRAAGRCCASAASTGGTRRSPPSSPTARCAGGAPTTRCSPPASTGRWTRVDPPVLDALRLGAHQLLGMRVPVARRGRRRPSTWSGPRSATGRAGFVNAVLRRVAGARPRRLARRGGARPRRRPGRPPGRRALAPAVDRRARSRDALAATGRDAELPTCWPPTTSRPR